LKNYQIKNNGVQTPFEKRGKFRKALGVGKNLKLLRMKKIFFLAIFTFSLNVFAQIPAYVPTNGIVAWWPFSGNANDISGNNLNGTVNGATLTTDRNGLSNSAYSFNGTNNYIQVSDNDKLSFTNHIFSISFWINANPITQNMGIIVKRQFGGSSGTNWEYNLVINSTGSSFEPFFWNLGGSCAVFTGYSTDIVTSNNWSNYTLSSDGSVLKIYKNGILYTQGNKEATCSMINGTGTLTIGLAGGWNESRYFKGKMDDIGIWNRALTQQEITDLYEGCKLVASVTPSTDTVISGSNVQFSVSANYANSNFQWQSNGGNLGWTNVVNNTTYSGATTSILKINNVQLNNHHQPFRVIATQATCIDTSNNSIIDLTDTCLVTVFDTNYISVTDTLIINVKLTGLPPNDKNTIKIFPNPAKDHITIDFVKYTLMNGYTLKITNSSGQTVYTTAINQKTSNIDLNTWTGKGIYFVHIIDQTSKTIEIRKIILK